MLPVLASARARISRQSPRTLSFWKKLEYIASPKFEIEPLVLLAHDSEQFENYIEKITTHSDQEYGGESMINYEFVDEPSLQAMRISGSFNFTSKHIREKRSKDDRIAKRGYCAVNVKFKDFQDLNDYIGFELVLRSQFKQTITMNFNAGYFSDTELFQLPITIPGGNNFIRMYLPFDHFRVKDNTSGITFQNDNLKLNGLGFLITTPSDDTDDFNIEFQSITAVNDMPRNSVPIPLQMDVVSLELRRMAAERAARKREAQTASEALLAKQAANGEPADAVVVNGENTGVTTANSSKVDESK